MMSYNYSSLQIPSTLNKKLREELIQEYFYSSYTYLEIIQILYHHHGIKISLTHLTRLLHNMGLRRYGRYNRQRLLEAVQHELQGSGSTLGYRSLTRRLLSRYGISAPRSLVAELVRSLDPEGVEARLRQRLRRRTYFNKGPNYLIHLDGYDKLKPYGFAIHGAICGYSRRILWLNVSNTNNDPKVTAYYFMQYVREISGVPRCIRSDAGTENVLIEDIQKAIRWDHLDEMAGENSFLIGTSNSNQHPLINVYFLINRECARFCFMTVIQRDLDAIRMDWNQHAVRTSSNSNSAPGGKPDLMYFLPELHGTVDYKNDVNSDEIEDVMNTFCKIPKVCDDDMMHMFTRQMQEIGIAHPSSAEEAMELFGQLMNLNQVNGNL